MKTTTTFAFLFLAFSCAAAARADVLYDGFANTSGLQLNGSAATASTTDGTVLRLTPAAENQSGSAFSFAKVNIAEFTSIFSFRITNPGGPIADFNDESGADGLVFVLQNDANNVVGAPGGGIGYGGIGASVGVEFDTWGNVAANDPSQSHIGINVNGSVDHNGSGMGPTAIIGDTNVMTTDLPGPELDDGDRWWSWVRYDGTDLDVFLLQSESVTEPSIPATPLLSFPIDLNSTLGSSDQAFAGFTSGTGSASANHDLLYWRYTESAIPEPSTLLLGALASVGLLMRRRRLS